MKRFAGMMGALLLAPTLALASGDMVSISELRQQVEAMGRWTKTYEAYGRTIEVDVPIIVPEVEKKIRDGHIRNVYTLRFGYCCYPAQNEEIILYPVWEIECDYVFDPKQEMRIYPEDDGIPITSGRYYSTMIVNAQTGEFMNPIELKEKLLDCPKIIRWEDIQ